jgi:transposase-like protein
MVDSLPSEVPDPEVPAKKKRRSFTVDYKLRMVAEYDAADAMGRGALLRREGLYTSNISTWRRERDRGAVQGMSRRRGPAPASPKDRRLAELEAANAQLVKDLDRARSVIKVQGELAALLEQLSTSSATNPSQSKDMK